MSELVYKATRRISKAEIEGSGGGGGGGEGEEVEVLGVVRSTKRKDGDLSFQVSASRTDATGQLGSGVVTW